MKIDPDALTHLLATLPFPPRVTVVPGAPDAPIVFLLDENHDVFGSIKENIANASALVSGAGVMAIGIENVPAGHDDFAATQASSPYFLPIPNQPAPAGPFERAIREQGYRVVGIDSPGWIDQIVTDCGEHQSAGAAKHPGQVERSKHFVRALFEDFQASRSTGNLLINSGADHNGHIMEIAEQPEAKRPEWWPNATFVRLRPPSLL